eukprot:464662-Rhodomonas_salina.1
MVMELSWMRRSVRPDMRPICIGSTASLFSFTRRLLRFVSASHTSRGSFRSLFLESHNSVSESNSHSRSGSSGILFESISSRFSTVMSVISFGMLSNCMPISSRYPDVHADLRSARYRMMIGSPPRLTSIGGIVKRSMSMSSFRSDVRISPKSRGSSQMGLLATLKRVRFVSTQSPYGSFSIRLFCKESSVSEVKVVIEAGSLLSKLWSALRYSSSISLLVGCSSSSSSSCWCAPPVDARRSSLSIFTFFGSPSASLAEMTVTLLFAISSRLSDGIGRIS